MDPIPRTHRTFATNVNDLRYLPRAQPVDWFGPEPTDTTFDTLIVHAKRVASFAHGGEIELTFDEAAALLGEREVRMLMAEGRQFLAEEMNKHRYLAEPNVEPQVFILAQIAVRQQLKVWPEVPGATTPYRFIQELTIPNGTDIGVVNTEMLHRILDIIHQSAVYRAIVRVNPRTKYVLADTVLPEYVTFDVDIRLDNGVLQIMEVLQ